MMWLLAGLAIGVVAVLRSAVEAEVDALLTKLPEWIVCVACRVLPKGARARYRDEMLADLDAEPDRPLWRLATALRIVCRIPLLRWNVRGQVGVGTDPAEPALANTPIDWKVEFRLTFMHAARQCGVSNRRANRLLHHITMPEPTVIRFEHKFQDEILRIMDAPALDELRERHARLREPPEAPIAS